MGHQNHKRAVSAYRRIAILGGVAVAILGPVLSDQVQPATAAAPRVLTSQPSVQVGVNTGMLFNSANSPAEIDAQLAALARTGTKVVRSDALWEDTEPDPPIGLLHRYNWGFDDLIARSLAAHGLQWLPIIDYSAPWSRSIPGQDHSPPASVSDYAAYAEAVAARYGPGGLFWIENPQLTPIPTQTYEIWNEPDNPVFWHPDPDASAYATLYESARAAITAVQPGADVLIGGLVHPGWFLSRMLAADPGISGQIDGVGIHPYGGTPSAVLAGVRSDRLAMRANGLADVPLYVTEFGWTTRPSKAADWAPEQKRPSYILRTLAALGHTDCGIAAVELYSWVTPERNPGDREDWYGISPPGGGGSADTQAFASGVQAAAAPGPTAALCAPGATAPTNGKIIRRSGTRAFMRRDHRDRRLRRGSS